MEEKVVGYVRVSTEEQVREGLQEPLLNVAYAKLLHSIHLGYGALIGQKWLREVEWVRSMPINLMF
ncbi:MULTISPECIES: hypothetical protein [Bacillus cereus group]|nr:MULTISPECIES: hypothetical protein [Bacillus cereus group]AWC44912.1 hypothetical protein CG479_010580 [Bacillus cytotoxicus]MDH2866541.1 hypothetical protein [Bacillus cytotoxicus]MDH2886445.1 hypothetical protein [Bacillus cytotoxicus]NZD34949.1 hypothetical protein [Bacillus cytotoxicus]QTR78112.1 hypothetical protein JC773_16540 [Bacillus cytotoxicus]